MTESRGHAGAAVGEPGAAGGGRLQRLLRDPYLILGLAIFGFIVIRCWTVHADVHEAIYLLGSRRIADPSFLPTDFTWTHLPPTSALFDHLLAPLWFVFNDLVIINFGRLVNWILFATSIAMLARAAALPAWSAFVGFAAWMIWGQTLAWCGSPLEGFQVKSFSYPLMFMALAFALRGKTGRAGFCMGLGTAFHIVVGGWACLALFIALLVNRRTYTLRQVALYLAAAAPFVAPLVLYLGLFHAANVTPAESRFMDWVYVTFAMPHCCDVDFFMWPSRWVRAAVVFPIASIVVLAWRERRAATLLGAFVLAMILFFAAGELAQRFRLYTFLKLYPCQLANSLPALFLFLFVPMWIAAGPPARRAGRLVWSLVLVGTMWLVINREMVDEAIRTPGKFAYQIVRIFKPIPPETDPIYAWIRANTPRDAVFITPFLTRFWMYAERGQVATMRHPPLDRRLIEWKERLDVLNQQRQFVKRGLEIDPELEASINTLPIRSLIHIRDAYGATHYMIRGDRKDLKDHLLHAVNGYSVYGLSGLTLPAEDQRAIRIRPETAPSRAVRR